MSQRHGGEWITLKEASKITGKSVNAIRLLVNRRKIDMVKKIEEKGRSYWVVHRESLPMTCGQKGSNSTTSQEHVKHSGQATTIPLEYYDNMRKEWEEERDKLTSGLTMYRYKFEEAERQLKLLPAPAHVVSSRLEELEHTVQEKDEVIQTEIQYRQQLSSVLHSQEARLLELEAELRHAKKPWWKKVLKLK